MSLCIFLILLVLIIIAVAIAGNSSGQSSPPPRPSSNSHTRGPSVVVRRQGRVQRYRVNRYGEVFKEER